MNAPARWSVERLREGVVSSRRGFLGGAAALGAGLALLGISGARRGALARSIGAGSEPAADMDTKFATVVPVSEWEGGGAWAIVSKWGQTFTLCNGGIIAGKDAVVMIDGFNTPGGASWASGMARRVAGRDPTHVVVTHFHFDHTDGLSGYLALPEVPQIISTIKTRELLAGRGTAGGGNLFFPEPASAIPGLKRSVAHCVLPDTVIADAGKPVAIDVGGRTIELRERRGHTASDLTVEIAGGGKEGQKVVFAGDLIFNRIFPVYLDAKPRTLRTNVAELIGEESGKNVIVPGHGAVTTGAELKPLLATIDAIAEAGRKAHGAGISAKEAALAFALPPELKEYTPTNPLFTQLAFEATYREIEKGA